ncbi:hypothetical protein B0H19DRAFT_165027 [Mycena capillaripes]|nr:hypothetical protein B0H19DRAFT_165027 [Mycena capillaripes]
MSASTPCCSRSARRHSHHVTRAHAFLSLRLPFHLGYCDVFTLCRSPVSPPTCRACLSCTAVFGPAYVSVWHFVLWSSVVCVGAQSSRTSRYVSLIRLRLVLCMDSVLPVLWGRSHPSWPQDGGCGDSAANAEVGWGRQHISRDIRPRHNSQWYVLAYGRAIGTSNALHTWAAINTRPCQLPAPLRPRPLTSRVNYTHPSRVPSVLFPLLLSPLDIRLTLK